MLSPAPPGHNIETYNKHSPREHSYYHPASLQTDTATEYIALAQMSPSFTPKLLNIIICFLYKRSVSSSLDSVMISHFTAPGALK